MAGTFLSAVDGDKYFKKENIMNHKLLIMSALLFLLVAGCSQSGADNNNSSNSATNAPADTNAPATNH
jgi:ABC-type Fe3+-citrate transport system substrate-binding protein